MGSSWSAYKAVEWGSLPAVAVCGVGLAGLLIQSWLPRWVRVAVWVTLLGAALGLNYVEADWNTRGFRQLVGSDGRPFETLLGLREQMKRQKPTPVLQLDFPHHEQKLRQMLIYFLRDIPLAGDWTDDGYIFPILPEAQRIISAEPGHSRRLYPSDDSSGPGNAIYGRIAVDSTGNYAVFREAVADYDRETDSQDWWYWVKNAITLRYRIQHAATLKLRIIGTINRVDTAFRVRCRLGIAQLPPQEFPVLFDARGGMLPLPLIVVPPESNEVEVAFVCDAPARTLGPADARKVTFMLKNLKLDFVAGP